MFRSRDVSVLLAMIACFPRLAPSQENINFASLTGRVTEPAGSVVSGAVVTARLTETNAANTTRTDAEGRFRFSYLKVGRYEIGVRQQGFGDFRQPITLTVGSAFDLPVRLQLAS